MCLNGWGGRLHEEAQAYLAREAPDVLCLQEVVHTPATSKQWLAYRDGDHELPQRANFFRDVSEALPDHVAIFCPAAQGVLWDGDEAIPSQWGRGRFPIIAQAQGFVHKGFSADGYGEHPRSRNAHVVRLHDFDRGWPITIAHMHGLRDLQGKIDTPERLGQVHRLLIRDNWLSNRIFSSYENIVDHCCDTWNKLTDQPWRIMSLGLRDWAHAF